MAQYDELVEALIWLLTNRVQNKINYSHGLLGDGQGRVRVAGHEDFVYARPDRFNSRTQQVFNKRVEGQDGDPIIIGELPWEPGLTQVISIDWRTYKEIGWGGDTSGFVYHGRTHIWKDAAPGLDTFPVYRRQLGDLQATASVSGTNAVDISSYSIELYGAQKQFPGTIGFPLDNAIPGGTGTARMALLYWDPSSGTTGYIGVATGTAGIDSESTLLNRPVSLPGTLPIAFVRLKAGQAGITEFNIFDAREPFRPGIGFGTGSSQFHAGLIPIADAGGFYTGTSVESALQEIGGGGGAHTHDASDVSIADAGGYYTGTSVESALQEIGGGSLPGDTFKVSKLWESDFGAVAWQTDAAGHLSATGKDLTTTGDISANDVTVSGNVLLTSGATKVAGSGSSNPSLGTEASDGRWGSIFVASGTQINTLASLDISAGAIGSEVVMIRLNNTAQDALYLGAMPSTSDDVDININDGQVFVRGSDGITGIGTNNPTVGPSSIFGLHVKSPSSHGGIFVDAAAGANAFFYMGDGGAATWQFVFDGTTTQQYRIVETGVAVRLAIDVSTGAVGIGTVSQAAQIHVDQASTTAAIPVAAFDQADLSEEFFEFISTVGAGNPIDTAAIGTYYGKIRVSVAGVGFKYMPLHNS